MSTLHVTLIYILVLTSALRSLSLTYNCYFSCKEKKTNKANKGNDIKKKTPLLSYSVLNTQESEVCMLSDKYGNGSWKRRSMQIVAWYS